MIQKIQPTGRAILLPISELKLENNKPITFTWQSDEHKEKLGNYFYNNSERIKKMFGNEGDAVVLMVYRWRINTMLAENFKSGIRKIFVKLNFFHAALSSKST